MTNGNIWAKSAAVGLSVLAIDWFIHENYANPETTYYYIFKFALGFILAYYLFESKDKVYGINFNPLGYKKNTTIYYLSWSVGFAALHGLYYRIIEIFQGQELFSRVGEISFNGIAFQGSIFMLALGWLIVHGGAFFIGVMIANKFTK